MNITADMVKELRESTGAGMMDCKKALTHTDGDMAKAVDYLREKGLAAAAKKESRIAAEGVVGTYICDKCGAELYIRDDDAEATVRKRLDTFHAQTEPLKDYYGAKGILVTVQGREEVEDTSAAVLEALAAVKCAD